MLAAVLGWPIQHSRSPKLHGHWLKRHALSGSYVALPVRPEDLAFCLPALPKMGFRGCNLTLPHKEIVLPLLDELEEAARAVGAVNTVCFEDGRLFGINTDIYGFSENLRVMAPEFHGDAGPVAILGAGGVARAALYALIALGAREIRMINRSRARAEALLQAFARPGLRLYAVDLKEAETALRTARLLVNASSLGMAGHADLTLPLDGLAKGAIVYDLVYTPLETSLLRAAKAHGLRAIDGLGMLLYQAKPAFHRFFGVDPVVDDELRAATLA